MIGFRKDIQIVLASASPRRKSLLQSVCGELKFEVLVPDIEEFPRPGENSREYVRRNSATKAKAVLSKLQRDQSVLVLAADTIVCLDENILEKPRDKIHAKQMLRSLSNRKHEVWTGVHSIFQDSNKKQSGIFFEEKTEVFFRELSDLEIENYIQTGEPMDKAGSYGAQGLASSFVKALNGSYTNVVGLPLSQWIESLRQKTPEIFERT